MNIWLIILIVAVVLLVVWAVLMFNKLVRLKVECDQAEAGIDVQLRRRADLVPNLVETVKGYARHESGVFEAVTEARAETFQATTVAEKQQASAVMGSALMGLFGVAEAYPDLKASANFLNLQQQLAETEDLIASTRRYYNATVQQYNTYQMQFPPRIVASMFGHSPREMWDLADDPDARNPVAVSFS